MKNLMKLKVVILFLIVFNPFITCYAGIFDLINPYLAGARKAGEEVKNESLKMGEPYGRFGTHLGMPEEDFLKICTDCKKTEYDMLSYKEIRIVSDIKASVVYFFSNIGKVNVLLQIVITPLVKYDIGNDLSKIYLIFQNYINNNIARMSDVKKIQDTNGNFIGYESYANFKYSSIFHTFTFNDGKIIHTISFYKTKQKD